MSDPNTAATGQTGWHRLLGKVLEVLLTPVGITVQTEVPITSEPPRSGLDNRAAGSAARRGAR